MRGVIAAAWRAGTAAAAPALRLMLRRRVARGKELPDRLPEREGRDTTPRPGGKLLWLHAASVGEAVSVLPLLTSLARLAPDLSVLFTTGTITSARLLAERLPGLGLHRVHHRFVPFDVPAWTSRFLDHWRPDAAAFVESELWPNLLAGCQARRIPTALLNGRMSARSLRQWRRIPGFARQVVGAFDLVHAQSADHADRLAALGARGALPPGNLKLAAPKLPVSEPERTRLAACLGSAPRWLAASTHPGEEAIAASVHRDLLARHPDLVTIVAPRHPERGAEAAAALGGAPCRSLGHDPVPGRPFVADTMGELGLLFALAPLVFLGKSLTTRGGQNPLEPARFGCALAAGPHTENFATITEALEHAGALTRVAGAGDLSRWIEASLADPEARGRAGAAAHRLADAEAGLPDRLAHALLALLAP